VVLDDAAAVTAAAGRGGVDVDGGEVGGADVTATGAEAGVDVTAPASTLPVDGLCDRSSRRGVTATAEDRCRSSLLAGFTDPPPDGAVGAATGAATPPTADDGDDVDNAVSVISTCGWTHDNSREFGHTRRFSTVPHDVRQEWSDSSTATHLLSEHLHHGRRQRLLYFANVVDRR
jgi:hypothetical protein